MLDAIMVDRASPPIRRHKHLCADAGYTGAPALKVIEEHGYPLTLLDDHSRFNLALQACPSVATTSVQPHLVQVFQRYGLPLRINESPRVSWRLFS